MDSAGKIFHALAFAYYCFSYYYYCEHVYYRVNASDFRPKSYQYGGDTKFLTMWCWYFQIVYFFFCCVANVMEMMGMKPQKMHTMRDWFLSSIAFPVGMMVVSMFWILWSIDRKLVFPKELDEFFPVWLNHVLHTNVLPILLVDMWLIRHKPPSKLRGVTTLSLFSALYMAWIFWLGYGVNIWVYPILRVLSGIKFVFFIVLCTTAPLPVYFLGEWCINVFHGPGERSKKVK
ncbi:androgen-induced gene 1 protein-like isoform X2 [Lytechinus pictus]|uniref:androgen-induced gene 1 protein-like isoform X2 n=1 Tax=Lytechinus pictus TaxID=7653 RepID=UPI00240DC337|nr:androgen-induced gene 1 protein-like isoform X1 [Lytechinus pictus]